MKSTADEFAEVRSQVEELERRIRNLELETHNWVATAGALTAQKAGLAERVRLLEYRFAVPERKLPLWRRKRK